MFLITACLMSIICDVYSLDVTNTYCSDQPTYLLDWSILNQRSSSYIYWVYSYNMVPLHTKFIAQWLGRWCTSLVAQVQFLACLVQSQLLQGENPKWCYCHLSSFLELQDYVYSEEFIQYIHCLNTTFLHFSTDIVYIVAYALIFIKNLKNAERSKSIIEGI